MDKQFSVQYDFQFNLTYKNELIDIKMDVSKSEHGTTYTQNERMNTKWNRKNRTEFHEMKNIIWFAFDQTTHAVYVFLNLYNKIFTLYSLLTNSSAETGLFVSVCVAVIGMNDFCSK